MGIGKGLPALADEAVLLVPSLFRRMQPNARMALASNREQRRFGGSGRACVARTHQLPHHPKIARESEEHGRVPRVQYGPPNVVRSRIETHRYRLRSRCGSTKGSRESLPKGKNLATRRGCNLRHCTCTVNTVLRKPGIDGIDRVVEVGLCAIENDHSGAG